MIDPVIFSFKLFNAQITMTWYGVIVIAGVFIGAWLAEREVRRRGENGDAVIDATLFAVLAGVVGARLWYVGNSIIAGNRSFVENPLSIIMPPYSGLHFFGGLLFGAAALVIYFRVNKYDPWLFFDAIAPATLIGQAIGRLGNFINIELYGQPTTLPWGFNVPADRRLPEYADLSKFPEGTLFHPTFFYEMVLNVLAFLFILWYSRRNEEENIKPGTVLSLWLIFAGFNRVFIEFFRPDQPKIGDTFITTSMLVAFLMGVAGLILFLVRTGKLDLAFAQNLPDAYVIKKVEKKSASSRSRKLDAAPATSAPAESEDEEPGPPAAKRRTSTRAKVTTTAKKPAAKKPAPRKKKAE